MEQNKSSGVKEDIRWYAAQEFYGRLHEKMGDFYDYFKAGEFQAALLVYRFLYADTLAYTEKHMKGDQKTFLTNHKDFDVFNQKCKPGHTDSEVRHNSEILREMLDLLFEKYLTLQNLMAKAQLNIPLDKNRNDLPAAFASDWK